MPNSEVAILLEQIELEYHASKLGLERLASGTALHDFIQPEFAKNGERKIGLHTS